MKKLLVVILMSSVVVQLISAESRFSIQQKIDGTYYYPAIHPDAMNTWEFMPHRQLLEFAVAMDMAPGYLTEDFENETSEEVYRMYDSGGELLIEMRFNAAYKEVSMNEPIQMPPIAPSQEDHAGNSARE